MKSTNLNKVLLIPFCLLTRAGCSDNNHNQDIPEGEEATSEMYISPTVPQGHITVESLKSYTGEFLGAGYDIMGDYISNTSIRGSVLDLSKIEKEKISIRPSTSGEADLFSGRDATEFLRSFTEFKEFVVPTENKDNLLFTATITRHEGLSTPYDYSSQYTFASENTGARIVLQRLLTLNPKWSAWFTDEFRQALEEDSPEAIIEDYGTHVLVNAHLGYTIKTIHRSVVADHEVNLLSTANTGMGARQKTIFTRPNISIDYPAETVNKNYSGAIIVSFQGGDYKSLPTIQLTPNEVIGDPLDIRPWIATCNEETYALTTLSGEDLVPIYDVIADPAKKQAIKAAVIAHIKSHQLTPLETAPILQATVGQHHRYYTSYRQLSEEKAICQGVIGSVFVKKEPGTIPLYQAFDKDDYRLLLAPSETGTRIIGYVYKDWSNGLDSIYEISDGKGYAYTRESKTNYGEKGSWRQTGNVFYTPKV